MFKGNFSTNKTKKQKKVTDLVLVFSIKQLHHGAKINSTLYA